MTEEPLAGEAARAERRDCLRCGAEVVVVGIQRIQVGRPGGGLLSALVGEGEGLLEVEMLVCDACRHIEMRATDAWFAG